MWPHEDWIVIILNFSSLLIGISDSLRLYMCMQYDFTSNNELISFFVSGFSCISSCSILFWNYSANILWRGESVAYNLLHFLHCIAIYRPYSDTIGYLVIMFIQQVMFLLLFDCWLEWGPHSPLIWGWGAWEGEWLYIHERYLVQNLYLKLYRQNKYLILRFDEEKIRGALKFLNFWNFRTAFLAFSDANFPKNCFQNNRILRPVSGIWMFMRGLALLNSIYFVCLTSFHIILRVYLPKMHLEVLKRPSDFTIFRHEDVARLYPHIPVVATGVGPFFQIAPGLFQLIGNLCESFHQPRIKLTGFWAAGSWSSLSGQDKKMVLFAVIKDETKSLAWSVKNLCLKFHPEKNRSF